MSVETTSPSSALLTCAMTNRPESSGVMAISVTSRLVVCSARPVVRVENLQANQKGARRARTPPDDDVPLVKLATIGKRCSRGGVGAKLGTVFRSADSKTLRTDALVWRLSAQTTTKPPSSGRHRGPNERLNLCNADLASGPDTSPDRGAQLHLRLATRRLFDPATTRPWPVSRLSAVAVCARRPGKVYDEFGVALDPIHA